MREEFGIAGLSERTKLTMWVALLASSSTLFSFALACATPFAALAALAGSTMPPRRALALVGVVWLANQAIGYLALGYPQTWDSFGWGAEIGLAAICATISVQFIARVPSRAGSLALSLIIAFLIFEGMLLVATTVLPANAEAFSWPVIVRIFAINSIAFMGLLALRYFALAIGLVPSAAGVSFANRC